MPRRRSGPSESQASRTLLLIFIGLNLGMLLSTLDGTIVATALPSITADIGGVSGITWVVTAYLLAQIATMPLYGKLGDVYGRKWVFLVAIGVFTARLDALRDLAVVGAAGRRTGAAGARRRWPRPAGHGDPR